MVWLRLVIGFTPVGLRVVHAHVLNRPSVQALGVTLFVLTTLHPSVSDIDGKGLHVASAVHKQVVMAVGRFGIEGRSQSFDNTFTV